MSIQSKIASATERLQRKLFDNLVKAQGSNTEVIRIKIQTDKYHDINGTAIIGEPETITIVLNLPPGGVPIYRLRPQYTGSPPTASDLYIDQPTGMYLYDILPIEGYTRFDDHVEWHDILVKKYSDENTPISGQYLKLIMQVTEVMGAFTVSGLTWRQFKAAPVTMTLPPDVQSVINNF